MIPHHINNVLCAIKKLALRLVELKALIYFQINPHYTCAESHHLIIARDLPFLFCT